MPKDIRVAEGVQISEDIPVLGGVQVAEGIRIPEEIREPEGVRVPVNFGYLKVGFLVVKSIDITALIVLYILVHSRVSSVSVTPAIGISTGRIRVTCHDESGERRNGSSAGRSGEHLTGSGDLTNQSGAHPTASGKCEKLYNHPNRWGRITTDSGILLSMYAILDPLFGISDLCVQICITSDLKSSREPSFI